MRGTTILLTASALLCGCGPTRIQIEVNKAGCAELNALERVELRVLRREASQVCLAASTSGPATAGERVLELGGDGGEVWALLLAYGKPVTGGCGDGVCDPKLGETCDSCSKDCVCGPKCGDQKCDPPEACFSCPADCGKCPLPGCGDGFCDLKAGEDCKTCLKDCKCEGCGDGKCNGIAGENCESCPMDCGKCDCPFCEVAGCIRCQGIARMRLDDGTVTLPLVTTSGCAMDADALVAAGLPQGASVLASPPCP